MLQFSSTASKLHQKIGETLEITSPFNAGVLKQEELVSEMFQDYTGGPERYDWVVPHLFVIIECHGIQHYKLQTFGGDAANALMNFKTQQFRDAQKREVALINGWTFIEVPYTDEKIIDSDYLLRRYHECFNPQEILVQEKFVPDWITKKKEQDKLLAKEERRKQYLIAKEFKNANKKPRT